MMHRCLLCGKLFGSYQLIDEVCQECRSECISNKDQFLDEYEELCRRYHLCVDACGCCDSPFISIVLDDDISAHIRHLRGGIDEQRNKDKSGEN